MANKTNRLIHLQCGFEQLEGDQFAAHQCLANNSEPAHLPPEIAAFGIRGGGGLTRLLMTHPPLEDRIAAWRAQG